MDPLYYALILSTLAGATIPLGAMAARWERIRPDWLEKEFRHSVIAFGGGVLYLTFQDIAPQSHIHRHRAPALGAVAGFCFALIGKMLLL